MEQKYSYWNPISRHDTKRVFSLKYWIIFLTNPCTRHICFGFFNDLFWISWQLFWDFSVKVFWQVQKVWSFPHQLEDIIHALGTVTGPNHCCWIMVDDFLLALLVFKNFYSAHIFWFSGQVTQFFYNLYKNGTGRSLIMFDWPWLLGW